MSYCYVDDRFPWHPKTLKAGGDAGWLWMCGYAWVQQHLTGGRIPKAAVPTLSDRRNPMKLAARLVAVGLWEDDGEDFVMHDYSERNPTAEHRRELRLSHKTDPATSAARAEAGRRGAARRWQTDGKFAIGPDGKPMAIAIGPDGKPMAKPDGKPMANGARAQAPPVPQTQVSNSGLNHQVTRVHEGNPDLDSSRAKPQVKGDASPALARWLGLFRSAQQAEAVEAFERCRRWFDEAWIDALIGRGIATGTPPKTPRWLLASAAKDGAAEAYGDPSHEVFADLARPLGAAS